MSYPPGPPRYPPPYPPPPPDPRKGVDGTMVAISVACMLPAFLVFGYLLTVATDNLFVGGLIISGIALVSGIVLVLLPSRKARGFGIGLLTAWGMTWGVLTLLAGICTAILRGLN